MIAKLGNVKMRRRLSIKVDDTEMDLIAVITREGIDFKVKHAKSGVSQTWEEIVEGCHTPDSTPQYLAQQPIKFLQHSESQIVRNALKRRGQMVD